MSRIARKPLKIPSNVDVKQLDNKVVVKGTKGELSYQLHEAVKISIKDGSLLVSASENNIAESKSMVGTTKILLENMVHGVSKGFERKLKLVGVGYRAKVQGKTLDLNLGFSHAINYIIPNTITITTPSNTEVIISGMDKQLVGQTAAEIRSLRPPEPYKGKGVRYEDEKIVLKETKKK
jgi:large subunit ribosomal protein L6